METHAPPRRQLVLAIAFTLVCVLVSIAAYTSFGGSVPLAPEGYRFELPLPDAGNLVQGSEVDIAGVTIGHVVSVSRSANGAVATLEIKPAYAPIRSDASAIVRTKTLLGEAYVELAPGPRSAPAIVDGGQLGAMRVRRAVALDQFLGAFRPVARQRMRALFAGLASALAGRGPSLNAALGYAAPVAANLDATLHTLGAETAQLQQLFASSGTVLAALGARRGDLQAAINAGGDLLRATAARNQQLAATVRALPPFLTQLRSTSLQISADSPTIDRAVAALLPTAPLLSPSLTAIDTYGPQFRALFNALPPTIDAGRSGLPALSSILSGVPSAFGQLYPTLRQLIPFMQLIAAYREPSIIAPLTNAGELMNGTFVTQNGLIRHRFGGVLYLSNETLTGWVKRLPTNRSNPYPTPTGLSELARIGFLKSYDCRNINNILYLPPLGSGVPPCVTQGPWTYNGVTAYYPRLQPAPR